MHENDKTHTTTWRLFRMRKFKIEIESSQVFRENIVLNEILCCWVWVQRQVKWKIGLNCKRDWDRVRLTAFGFSNYSLVFNSHSKFKIIMSDNLIKMNWLYGKRKIQQFWFWFAVCFCLLSGSLEKIMQIKLNSLFLYRRLWMSDIFFQVSYIKSSHRL